MAPRYHTVSCIALITTLTCLDDADQPKCKAQPPNIESELAPSAMTDKLEASPVRNDPLPPEILGDCLRTLALLRFIHLLILSFIMIQPKRSFFVDVCSTDGKGNGINRDVLQVC